MVALRVAEYAPSSGRPVCDDLPTLLDFTWFGAHGPPPTAVDAAGRKWRVGRVGHDVDTRAAMTVVHHDACRGVPEGLGGAREASAPQEASATAEGELSPPKGASSSPNTPLSDRLLSQSPGSAASASGQHSPAASTSLQAGREEPELATGCSPRSSGSLSVQSIRLCFPPAPMQLVPTGPVASSPLLAASDSARPAVACPPDGQWLTASGTAAAWGEPARMQPHPGVPRRSTLHAPPEIAWPPSRQAERQAGEESAAVRSAAAAQHQQQQPGMVQRRPQSLLSMQLRDCSRQSASSLSGLDCPGRHAATPTLREATAFWSASAGAPAPGLASPSCASTAQAPPRDPGLHHHLRLMTAVSAPAPALAAAADEPEPQALAGEGSLPGRTRSLAAPQRTEPAHSRQSAAEASLGGASAFGSEHRAVRDWLAACGASGSPGRAGSAPDEEEAAEQLPPLGGPFGAGGHLGFAAHTVVCAGFSPARRHMSEQRAGARQRAAGQLRRAQTCPEPMDQEANTNGLGSWAERIFLHRLGE